MKETPTLLVVLRHSPWNDQWFAEGLDAALVGAVFGQNVQLMFMGQGAMGLIRSQESKSDESVKSLALLESIDVYGVHEVIVPEADLGKLELSRHQLIDGVHVMDNIQLQACFSNADYVLNF